MKRILAATLALLASAGLGIAQELHAPAPVAVMADHSAVLPYGSFDDGQGGKAPRGWVSAEYLNWWITKGPIGVPLVTTGNPLSPNAGKIGDPSTVVLFGNSSVDFGALHGGRLSMGYWFGCDAQFGVEGSGFGF